MGRNYHPITIWMKKNERNEKENNYRIKRR